MQSDKLKFGQPGITREKKAPRDYICNGASGLSAGLQDQQLTGSESENVTKTVSSPKCGQTSVRFIRRIAIDADNVFESVCCVCLEIFSGEDQKVLTKCCKEAIGSYCRSQHIANFGECWNCGEEEAKSEALSDTESWTPYDPKDFVKEAPRLPPYASLLPAYNTGRRLAGAMVKANRLSPSESTTGASNTFSVPDYMKSERSAANQRLFTGLSEEQRGQEAMYQLQGAKEGSADKRTVPQASLSLTDGSMKNSARHGSSIGDFGDANATPNQQVFLYDGSDSANSEFSQDDQQHGLTREEQKRQEAKHYVIEATKHLVEMCNLYGDEIDEVDKDEIMDEILEAVGGQSLITTSRSRDVSNRLKAARRFKLRLTSGSLDTGRPQPSSRHVLRVPRRSIL